MKEYIVTLTSNLGIGKDIINYLTKRGCVIVYDNREILHRTLIISTDRHIEELRSLKYVGDVKEASMGRFNV